MSISPEARKKLLKSLKAQCLLARQGTDLEVAQAAIEMEQELSQRLESIDRESNSDAPKGGRK